MTPLETTPRLEGTANGTCWSRMGVQGDRSCPQLAEAGHCRNCSVFSEAGQSLFRREAPPDYLEQWTRQLAEADAAPVTDSQSLLIFRIGAEWLALEARWIVEVISPRPIHRIPHRSNRLLLGLANIRGELQLCISLQELLGLEALPAGAAPGTPASTSAGERMIVTEHEQSRWVFAVDDVEGVHQIPAAVMENLPYTVERSPHYFSRALFCHGNHRVGALSVARLFQTLERTIR